MKIPLFRINYTEDDIKAVEKVISRGRYWAKGKEIIKFEDAIKEYVGSEYCLVFNSGTSALIAAIQGCGLKHQDFLVPNFTYRATWEAVEESGNYYSFGEIEKDTYGLAACRCIDNVVLVHIAGFPARDTLEWIKITKENKSFLIEDACESFGATIDGKMVGTFGDVGVYSFNQSKIITTGEGGAIVTNRKEIYDRAREIRLKRNWSMSSIAAALGLSQLKRVEEIISRNRVRGIKLGNRYPHALKNIWSHAVYQMYLIELRLLGPHIETKERFQGCPHRLLQIPLELADAK